jgi:hypothetical protein
MVRHFFSRLTSQLHPNFQQTEPEEEQVMGTNMRSPRMDV